MVYTKQKEGAKLLAKKVIEACEFDNSKFEYSYDTNTSIKTKIENIATKVYGAKGVEFSEKAEQTIKTLEELKLDKLPIVIAKTQYSLSDDAKLLGRPKDFCITIRDLELKNGAGFIVALAGNMMLMPGLSKIPNAVNMKINDNKIEGLF